MPTWLPPLLSLVASIIMFWLARKHTDNTANKLRAKMFALDEWKLNRTEVVRSLRQVEECFDRLKILVSGAHGKDELDIEIEKEGRALTIAHGAMLRELDRFEPDWTDCGFGAMIDGESDWDRVNTKLDEARQASDADAARNDLSELSSLGASLSRMVMQEVRAKTNEHNPERI